MIVHFVPTVAPEVAHAVDHDVAAETRAGVTRPPVDAGLRRVSARRVRGVFTESHDHPPAASIPFQLDLLSGIRRAASDKQAD